MTAEQNITTLKDAFDLVRLNPPTLRTLKYVDRHNEKATSLDEFLTIVRQDREFCALLSHPDCFKRYLNSSSNIFDNFEDHDARAKEILVRNFSGSLVIALHNNHQMFFVALALDKEDFLEWCDEDGYTFISHDKTRKDATAYDVLKRYMNKKRRDCEMVVKDGTEFKSFFMWDGHQYIGCES